MFFSLVVPFLDATVIISSIYKVFVISETRGPLLVSLLFEELNSFDRVVWSIAEGYTEIVLQFASGEIVNGDLVVSRTCDENISFDTLR